MAQRPRSPSHSESVEIQQDDTTTHGKLPSGLAKPSPGSARSHVEEVEQGSETEFGAPSPVKVMSVYEQLEVTVVNPSGTEGLRFLSAKINLGLASPEVEVFIEENKQGSKIRDRLIDILRSKTITQLEPENHQRLKDEIKERLNVEGFLGVNAVVEVYFQNFVLQ